MAKACREKLLLNTPKIQEINYNGKLTTSGKQSR